MRAQKFAAGIVVAMALVLSLAIGVLVVSGVVWAVNWIWTDLGF